MIRPSRKDKRIRSYEKLDGKNQHYVVFERPDGSQYTLTVEGPDPNRKSWVTLKGGPGDGERVKVTRAQRLGRRTYYKDLGNYKEALYIAPCAQRTTPTMELIYLRTQNKRLSEIYKTGNVYEIGGGWGSKISWVDYDRGKVSGHKRNRPNEGDFLECEMQSGRTGVFRFTDVEHCSDPNDMFFGTVEAIGYKDEL